MKEILELLFYLSFFPLFIFALIAILNVFIFPRLKTPKTFTAENAELSSKNSGLSAVKNSVSVLIPMRNEATVIGGTVKSLLEQNYPNLEILLLDDGSSDDSASTALRAADGDPRLKVLAGKPLPAGWFGKAWACQQLSEQAAGEYFLFTDADVNWQPEAISALMAEAAKTESDLLTAWPRQETVTWAERLVVPLMGFSIRAYLPALAVHNIRWPVFAAAIGQCLLFKRAAYIQIGGHASAKDKIADDMTFAYAIKGQGLRFRMVESNGLLTCRMYRNWDEVRNGYAKNILAGHGGSLAFLLFSTVFHWWIFVVPWLWLGYSLLVNREAFLAASLFTLPGVLVRALTAASTHQRIQDALFMPVSVCLMTMIAFQALKWHFSGGPQWKGRSLSKTV
jgi:chlorobactene glucosyltransferase